MPADLSLCPTNPVRVAVLRLKTQNRLLFQFCVQRCEVGARNSSAVVLRHAWRSTARCMLRPWPCVVVLVGANVRSRRSGPRAAGAGDYCCAEPPRGLCSSGRCGCRRVLEVGMRCPLLMLPPQKKPIGFPGWKPSRFVRGRWVHLRKPSKAC